MFSLSVIVAVSDGVQWGYDRQRARHLKKCLILHILFEENDEKFIATFGANKYQK